MNPEKRDETQIGERAQQLLKVLIESYIREGQPVGSRSLSRDSGLNLSSATIRNVMADLEAYGFVSSPHTSAGRVPTPKGYRFFIDTLLKVQPLETAAADQMRRQFTSAEDPRALVSHGLAAAFQCHADGGPGFAADAEGRFADPYRIPAAVRTADPGHPGLR